MNDSLAAILPLLFPTLSAGVVGLWAVMGSIRKQFDLSRKESEDRVTRTHARIDDLRQHMGENFVSVGAYVADQRRIDDAIATRDGQIKDLCGRLNCPTARGE